MAYSMLECPKLHNSKSLKFYPEEYDHHVSFRHKNLPPDFELTMENCPHFHSKKNRNYSIEVQSSTHKKCPIYVHNFTNVHQNDGDCHPKNLKKTKKKHVMNRLEETYWANWKPDKGDKNKTPVLKNTKSPEIQIIKSAPMRKKKIRVFPDPEDSVQIEVSEKIPKVTSVSQEIQTEDISEVQLEEILPPVEEEVPSEQLIASSEDVAIDDKFLRHTDSFILNVKKQQEEKDNCDQPKCIRLYRKAGKSASKNFVKGGSYPLKSCLKRDSNFSKSSKLARPGSPMIVSSSFSTRGKHGKNHRF